MKMKAIRNVVLVAGLAVGLNAQAGLITTLFNTGVNGAGVVLPNNTPDPHYSLIAYPVGSSTTTIAITSAGGFPYPIWPVENSWSTFIRPNNPDLPPGGSDNDPGGTYKWRTTFDLSAFDHTTASIAGQWMTDDTGGSILLNGVPIGNAPQPGYASGWTAFAITSGFISGINTLDFTVVNSAGVGSNPVGLRVEMLGNATVPEPATFVAGALLLLPFGISTIRRIRKS